MKAYVLRATSGKCVGHTLKNDSGVSRFMPIGCSVIFYDYDWAKEMQFMFENDIGIKSVIEEVEA